MEMTPKKNCKKGWLYSYNVLLNKICFNVDGFPSSLPNYVKDYGRTFFYTFIFKCEFFC